MNGQTLTQIARAGQAALMEMVIYDSTLGMSH